MSEDAKVPRYLAREIEDDLRAAITSGQYRTGDKLPTENALGQKYGVSRTVVREAIAGLRAAGTVVSRRGSGVFVAEERLPVLPPPAEDWPRKVPDVIDALELRAAVEVEAARLAASRASIGQIEEIYAAERIFARKIADGADAAADDFAFHRAIARATNNAAFDRFLAELGPRTIPRRELGIAHGTKEYAAYMARLEAEHRAIVAAIEGRDAQAAAAAMAAHLLGSLKRYRDLSRLAGERA
ncbi:FadR/GntR family transcriptional regulator [Acuticoccus sp. I52.16.1]|uniref:FadR/GntR family transcriptional regulator n=1 Tax=Acuticoccus sp. I52.16.1 TaxID=2928472 RepID=UPI001FD4CFB2|nr:GntR family transcriptional regulator [Acuticoccus sp. I52.16.1]UOM33510.1 GntR family transcriptional regulator [Acuticoccus sp. I52.16.1]